MHTVHDETINFNEEVKSFSTEGLLYLPYCRDSGALYCDRCTYDPRGVRLDFGYFTYKNRPVGECTSHKLFYYDEMTGAIACDKCPKDNLKIVALISTPHRSFPCEITVTDAEYVWRRMGNNKPLGDSYDLPYFIYTLEDGEYCGRSKGKKQFNSSCYLHND